MMTSDLHMDSKPHLHSLQTMQQSHQPLSLHQTALDHSAVSSYNHSTLQSILVQGGGSLSTLQQQLKLSPSHHTSSPTMNNPSVLTSQASHALFGSPSPPKAVPVKIEQGTMDENVRESILSNAHVQEMTTLKPATVSHN